VVVTLIKNKFQLKAHLHYNQYTGDFTRIQAPLGARDCIGKVSGDKADKGKVSIYGEWYQLGRLAFLYMTGKYPDGFVCHKDGNVKNLKWANLEVRQAAGSLTCRRDSGSITWVDAKNRHQVYIGKKYIGVYKTLEDAQAALDAIQINGG